MRPTGEYRNWNKAVPLPDVDRTLFEAGWKDERNVGKIKETKSILYSL
jgi:hypothetical protein